MRSYIKRMTNY